MSERPTAAVLGTGLLGASLALALRQSGRFGSVTAWDPDFDAVRAAQRSKVADRYPRSPQDAVQHAALVFVGVAPGKLRDLLQSVSPHLAPGAIVCTLGLPHEAAGDVASQVLPESVSFVCGYPVLWEAVSDETVPAASLIEKAIFCLSPLPTAHPDAVAYVAGLAAGLGMEPYFVDAREPADFFPAAVETRRRWLKDRLTPRDDESRIDRAPEKPHRRLWR